MAGEIVENYTLRVKNPTAGTGYQCNFTPGSKTSDQSAIGAYEPIVIVGTSEEDLATGDVSTKGVLVLQNLDGTNYVTYGPNNSGSMVALFRLNPGEIHRVRLDSSATLRWQANTASVKVKVILLEN